MQVEAPGLNGSSLEHFSPSPSYSPPSPSSTLSSYTLFPQNLPFPLYTYHAYSRAQHFSSGYSFRSVLPNEPRLAKLPRGTSRPRLRSSGKIALYPLLSSPFYSFSTRYLFLNSHMHSIPPFSFPDAVPSLSLFPFPMDQECCCTGYKGR